MLVVDQLETPEKEEYEDRAVPSPWSPIRLVLRCIVSRSLATLVSVCHHSQHKRLTDKSLVTVTATATATAPVMAKAKAMVTAAKTATARVRAMVTVTMTARTRATLTMTARMAVTAAAMVTKTATDTGTAMAIETATDTVTATVTDADLLVGYDGPQRRVTEHSLASLDPAVTQGRAAETVPGVTVRLVVTW